MNKKIAILIFSSAILLCGCSRYTKSNKDTIFENNFYIVSAGNYELNELDEKPDDYEEYYGLYILSYSYDIHHDGTISRNATYFDGENKMTESKMGTYKAYSMGPNQKIWITFDDEQSILTWEPNWRDPSGSLAYRLHETKIMSFLAEERTAHIVLRSKHISLNPI